MVRNKEVEAALIWAQRQGYVDGAKACAIYAAVNGLGVGLYDPGIYGDEVEFFDTPAAAAEAQKATPGKYNPHKPAPFQIVVPAPDALLTMAAQQAHDSYLDRFPADQRDTADRAYTDGFTDCGNAQAPLIDKLRDAVEAWPQFDDHSGAPSAEVNGADLVEWFGSWREEAKALLAEESDDAAPQD